LESAQQLSKLLTGDLDNILSKALKKNPAERYRTVTAFADDLNLSHEWRGGGFAMDTVRICVIRSIG
jgi:hypothetical protein